MNIRRKRLWITVAAAVAAVAVIVSACAIYLSDYYRADQEALAAFAPGADVTVTELDGGDVVFEPDGARTGFIFYPGGKVEHNAYRPLMAALADEGVLCVLVKMPFNLAVFDINAADGIRESYPDIERWYIGGHSLGGSMAASYLADNTDSFAGLVLLGSYSTEDLSDSSLEVLSVYGSEDRVLNREKYEDNRANLPADFSELVIEGGCHAYFGSYGRQDGDGEPSITAEEQIAMTVEAIIGLVN